MGRHADFWQVTGDALDFAMEAHGVSPGGGLRDRLMELYRALDAHPDFRVIWCNRTGAPRERIPAEPDATVMSLSELPSLILRAAT